MVIEIGFELLSSIHRAAVQKSRFPCVSDVIVAIAARQEKDIHHGRGQNLSTAECG